MLSAMPSPNARRWAYAAAAFVALLATAEAVARLRRSDFGPVPRRWHERLPQPYTMFGRCVSPPDAGPKPAGEFRIVMLGGSTVALGEPPVPVLLESALRRRGYGRARVYNCGVVSQNTSQQLARLVFEVADFAPDLVVAYDGGNDVMDPYEYDPRPGYPMNFLAYERNPLFVRDPAHYPLLPLLLLGSQALRDLFPRYFAETLVRLPQARRAAGHLSPVWREAIARRYVENHRKASLVAGAFGAGYAAFFQPLSFYREGRDAVEGLRYDDAMREHAVATRAALRREFDALPKTGGPRLFDLSGLFADPAVPVYTDFIHTRQDAKAVVAEAIAQRLSLTPLLGRARR